MRFFMNSKMKKISILIGALVVVSTALIGCGADNAAADEPIKVGSKDFTEQLILGELTMQALENAGFEVEDNTNIAGSDKLRSAQMNGEVDVYWEYTGTAWLMHLQNDEAITDSQEAYDLVKEADAENGLVWLDYAPLNNTYTIMMKESTSEELGIQSISDLADYVNENPGQIRFAADHEFTARPDGLPALEETYGFQFEEASLNVMDMGIVYTTLRDDQIDSGMGFATDGRIEAFDFVNLEDDKNFFPVYNAAPVVREDVLEANPEIADILNEIAVKLDNDTIIRMNYMVDIEEMEPSEVAAQWLEENGIVE